MYYITYDINNTRDKKEFVMSKKGSTIKDDVLFDPFSEFKMMHRI